VIVIVCLHWCRVVGVESQGLRVVAIWPTRGGVQMEVIPNAREDPVEEVVKSN